MGETETISNTEAERQTYIENKLETLLQIM